LTRSRPLQKAIDVPVPTPDLIADVYLYETEQGGKRFPIQGIYRFPCFARKDIEDAGWDCTIEVGQPALYPGQKRRIRFVFLSGREAVTALARAEKFYLWEGKFIGEAEVVQLEN
jgi:hypothetical protein